MTKLFISVLDWVHSWVGNYGWSVVVFTLLIKLCLTPLDVKSRRSMRQMALLNPKLEELKKRYGNDQEKLNMKTQELYKKNKVNPLSGCLPLLIQLPILYIMFAAMRQVAARMQIEIVYNWISTNLSDGAGNLLAVDSEQVQAVLESIRNGTAAFGDTQSWLWIKSVFQPDNFGRTVMPTLSELTTICNQYMDKLTVTEEVKNLINLYIDNANGGANAALANAVDLAFSDACGYKSFNLFLNFVKITYPSNWGNYVNGYYVLPVLAGLTQILATKLQPASAAPSNDQNGTGKFMKWFFPILSVWICISSNAAFAIYWVFVNVWSIISSYGVNYYIEKQEKAAANGSDSTKKEALQP